MNTATQLTEIPIRIIKEQELVIGPLAWAEASKVAGLDIDQDHKSISFSQDGPVVIDRLVAQYEKIFGKASHETCKDAVADLISQLPPEEVPSSLR